MVHLGKQPEDHYPTYHRPAWAANVRVVLRWIAKLRESPSLTLGTMFALLRDQRRLIIEIEEFTHADQVRTTRAETKRKLRPAFRRPSIRGRVALGRSVHYATLCEATRLAARPEAVAQRHCGRSSLTLGLPNFEDSLYEQTQNR